MTVSTTVCLALFWMIATLVSAYYGTRGVLIAVRDGQDEDIQRIRDSKAPWSRWQRVIVHYVHAFAFNFIGSLTGFVALLLARALYRHLGSPPSIEAGAGVLLVFLGLVAITGMTGILPELLSRGGVFGVKSPS
jgi:hypothetical protein